MIEHGDKPQLFFSTLQTKDITTRRNFLDELEKEFDGEEDSYLNDNNNFHNGNTVELNKANYYPVILRLAYECPFEDVRHSCSRILKNLEEQGVRIPRLKSKGPSTYISENECVPIDVNDDETQSLFVETFISNGRVSHVHQIIGYHVRYLSCFIAFESKLLSHDGLLPAHWIYYIGLIGAARHRCGPLIEECERMFLMSDGEDEWLQSLDKIPTKLKKLFTLNKLLAHQPWLINSEVIREFFNGPKSETWTMSELLRAILVLLHFHSLSGFIFGCGITHEIDSKKGHTFRTPSSGEYTSGSEPLTPTKVNREKGSSFLEDNPGTAQLLLEKIAKVQEEYERNSQDGEDEASEEKLRQFNEVQNTNVEDEELSFVKSSKYDLYIHDKDFHYEEFAKRERKDIEVFRAHDYNWQEHCFAFVNRLYPSIGNYLDDKFNCSFDLTYNSMGDNYTDVDTSKFRIATWNYIQLIYGIYHDDYLYVEVNKLLVKPYKSYIKKVACSPESITFLDYLESYTDFLPSEKVHINLLVLESRFQASLLYASRALMSYMDNS